MYIFEIVFALDGPYLALLIGGLITWIWIFHSIYFHFRYKEDIAKRLCKKNGYEYIDAGLIMATWQLGGYALYCLSSRLAKRDGVYEFFSSLPRSQRYHLVFNFYLATIGGVLVFGSGGIIEYFGL